MTLYRKIQKALGIARPGLYELLPSFGFFSGNKALALPVSLNGEKVSAIRLTRMGDQRDFLNLKGIEVTLSNGQKLKPSEVASVSVSSCRQDADPTRLLRLEKFHTKAEIEPWWQMSFDQPTALQSLLIYNRPDQWGKRSDKLQVSVLRESGEWETLYHRDLPEVKQQLLAPLQKYFPLFKRGYNRQKLLRDMVAFLEEKQITQKQKLSVAELKAFLQVTSVWSDQQDNSIENAQYELKILAHCLSVVWEKHHGLNPREFSALLSSKKSIKQLEQEVNRVRDAHDLAHIMITKHGVAKRSKLLANPEKTVRSMKKIMSELEDMALEPVLAYGTLLGAVREKSFIGHDDDVDILIRVNAKDRPAVQKKMDALCRKFRKRGYRIGAENHNLNRHIKDPETKFMLDVFPYWEQDGRAQLHMEKMKVRGIAAEIFAQRSQIDFYGETFPVPHKPEAFLQERYGEGWGTPDEFHEWPWPLEEG